MTEVESVPANSTEKLKESAAELVEALNLLAKGKRNMVCGEVPQACNQLQECCRLLAKKYGETANECGEAYLCYGKALLDMSRMESGVLGNALQGIEEDEEESDSKSSSEGSDKVEDPEKTPAEEREKISDQVIDAMLETDEELSKRIGSDDEPKENKDKTKENKDDIKEGTGEPNGTTESKVNGTDDAKKVENGAIEINGEDATAKVTEKTDDMETDEKKEAESEELNTEEEGETEEEEGEAMDEEAKDGEGEAKEGEGEAEGEKKKDDEEDVTNLQLAWEMLELAKIIYKRESSKENKLKLAEAFLKLGEVGLETEQYDQAISDFNECLKIQKSVLESSDRFLAETHYQLGVANTYACKYNEAIASYNEAAHVIKLKLESLQKFIEESPKDTTEKDVPESEDPVYKARKEISELKDILPDIVQKIGDVEDEKKSADVAKAMIKDTVATMQQALGEAGSISSSSGDGPSTSAASGASTSGASDITHLVRKKRKSDDGREAPIDAKKSKSDESCEK